MRKFRTRVRAAALAALTLLILVTGIPGAARADVGRPNNAEAEIENYYREFLGRPSDPAGFASYRDRMWGDCKFGVLAAGMMIGDSAEAHNRLRDPRTFASAMYRALLNRPADSGGLSTYVNVINARGYRWALRDIQASTEFRGRLNAMCQGRRGSMTQNELKPEAAAAAAVGVADAGRTLYAACGVGAVITLAGGWATKGVYEATRAISAAKMAMETAVNKGAVGACLSGYQVLKSADEIVKSANYYSLLTYPPFNNPTYVYLNQWETREWNGRWCHVQMGAGPSAPERSWREIKFRC